jgi:hypothetical protein
MIPSERFQLGLKIFSERFLQKDSILKDSILKNSILKDSGFVEKSDSERFHFERFRAPFLLDHKYTHYQIWALKHLGTFNRRHGGEKLHFSR